jgi:hypothetical protein
LGLAGVGVYLVVGFAIILASRVYLLPGFMNRVTDRECWILALGTLGCLLVLFLLIYPIADSGVVGGGSDSDDALNLGARALLNQQYPYRIHTGSGTPVTYLPGSLLLAVPFVILGNAAYQNWFWLALFLLAIRLYLKGIHQAILLFWMTFLCTRIWQLLLTGGERLASSIYIVLFVLFAMRSLVVEQPRWFRWLAAVLLGIGLSSRANYLLLAPVIFSAALKKVGWSESLRYAAVTAGAFMAVTLPFWLHDPQMFWVACLREQNFAAVELNTILPHADVVLPLASTVFAVGLSFRRLKDWDTDLLSSCALAQAFPVFAIFLLSIIDTRRLDLSYLGYGVHFLFFGALASWNGFVRSAPHSAV